MIFIASDHRGFPLKEEIKKFLKQESVEFRDLGNSVLDPRDDYPDFALALAEKIRLTSGNLGILICGTGTGMVIAANKVPGIRASLAWQREIARKAREEENANVLCLAADYTEDSKAREIVKEFLGASFSGVLRHKRRISKIESIENRFSSAQE